MESVVAIKLNDDTIQLEEYAKPVTGLHCHQSFLRRTQAAGRGIFGTKVKRETAELFLRRNAGVSGRSSRLTGVSIGLIVGGRGRHRRLNQPRQRHMGIEKRVSTDATFAERIYNFLPGGLKLPLKFNQEPSAICIPAEISYSEGIGFGVPVEPRVLI
ncbi:predicted protein [Verticillium alfalfae VaMs.102]|uniref:Predicted protein n=1 Tax=Verticillium alfalfae (strain VaMs.102 / ATCC MYA-4576 / FGSC 10136) TaxID=526221 RepID=C9SW52_VERA1|nr:predicted protein [Verticillium alfalfae VaMs.102]EEY23017.1 predicted protein [Verticillium alfalfae VaMs.102]